MSAFEKMFKGVCDVEHSPEQGVGAFGSMFNSSSKKNKDDYEKNKVINKLASNSPKLKKIAMQGDVNNETKIVISPKGVFATMFTTVQGKDVSNASKADCNGKQITKGVK